MRCFRVYGLRITSDFDLLLPEDPSAAAPALRIQRAPSDFFHTLLSKAGPAVDAKWYRFFPDGSCHLCWNGLFDFFVASDGRAIVCGPRGEAVSEACISYLLSFALSFALLRMGEEVLHATVVETGGHAIGFLGKSGAGKSTLASYFLERGSRLVTDDMLRTTFRDHSVIAHPGPQRIKLFPEIAAQFMRRGTCTEPLHPYTTKQIIAPPKDQSVDVEVPLKTLYVLDCLETTSSNSVKVEPLCSGEAALSCIVSTFNAVVQTSERLARQLRFTSQLLSKVPVLRLSYPRRYEALGSVYELVGLRHRQ